MGTRLKRYSREADHSPPYVAKIKNDGALPLLLYKSSGNTAYLIKLEHGYAPITIPEA